MRHPSFTITFLSDHDAIERLIVPAAAQRRSRSTARGHPVLWCMPIIACIRWRRTLTSMYISAPTLFTEIFATRRRANMSTQSTAIRHRSIITLPDRARFAQEWSIYAVDGDGVPGLMVCQRPVGTAHGRPAEVPAGGHENCPFAARSSAHWVVVDPAVWRAGSVHRGDSFSGEGLGQADGVAAGLAEVGVVQQPVHGRGGEGLRHQLVEP